MGSSSTFQSPATKMATFISEPVGIDQSMAERLSSIVGPRGFRLELDRKDDRKRRYICADLHGRTLAKFSQTNVFDAFEIVVHIDEERMQREICKHSENMLPMRGRRVINLSDDVGDSQVLLLSAEDHDATGKALCELANGELIFIASTNFLREGIREENEVLYVSAAAYAIRVNAWTRNLDEYVKGVVSGSPPVVVGVFPSRASVIEFCEDVSAAAAVPGTTFDLGVMELARPMISCADWAVALNQGDSGYESAVFAICNTKKMTYDRLSSAITIDAVVSI